MESDSSRKGFVSTDMLLPMFSQQNKKRETYQRANLIFLISCIICVVACFVAISCAIYSFNAMQTINKTNVVRAQQDAATAFKNFDDKDNSEFGNSPIQREKRAIKGNQNTKKPGKTLSIPAAHFKGVTNVQNLIGGKYDTYRETVLCQHVVDIQGTLCLNRTFFPDGDTLRIFTPANFNDEALSPVTFHNSVLSAKTGGMYYVYAQVLISGSSVAKAASIVQKRNGEEIMSMSCHIGMHANHNCSEYEQPQTCSVSGLMKLNARDTLEIQKNGRTTAIDAGQNTTYFGVFQLSEENTKAKSNNTDRKTRKEQKQ